ncbi:MAG: hypothetical protein H0X47_08880 [Nitrospirales bacterium]|nr:hypothetical protein [Nitrospirales bacterium]
MSKLETEIAANSRIYALNVYRLHLRCLSSNEENVIRDQIYFSRESPRTTHDCLRLGE